MKRFLFATLVLTLLVPAAQAQDIPQREQMKLWCGIALGIVTADAPTDATPDQQALIQRFAAGSEQLIAEAREVYAAHGYNATRFDAHVEQLTADVVRQVNAVAEKPAYSFEDCSALIES